MYPENFRYTKEHEWVRVEDGIATMGITDHAQHELGDIVYVDLPKPGANVEKGKSLGTVESVKAVSEKLNEDPHGEAWLVKIRLRSSEDLVELLSANEYEAYVGAEK